MNFGKPWIDGTGSILIGLVLAGVAIFLARDSKALLIGEGAPGELRESIRRIVLHQPQVHSIETILTTQLSPDQVIATLGIEFADDLRIPEVEALIGKLECDLRKRHPDLYRVFVRPTSSVERKRGAAGTLKGEWHEL